MRYVALLFAVIAGFLPPFSAVAPERLNLRYVEREGKAEWIADPVTRLPGGLIRAVRFSPLKPVPLLGRGYVADAGAAEEPPPDAAASRTASGLTIHVRASSKADGIMLVFPHPVTLKAVDDTDFPDLPPSLRVTCDTSDCGNAALTFAGNAISSFDVIEMRRDLPAKGKALWDARPAYAVPSGGADQTLLLHHVTVSGS